MDPSLFRIDMEVLGEVLIAIIVLSFFVERALALLFEHRLYVNTLDQKGFKEPIAFLVSLAIVVYWQFDAMSVLLRGDETSGWGYVVTAAIIAGGSKASIKLFHDLMNVKTTVAKQKAAAAAGGGQPAAQPGGQK